MRYVPRARCPKELDEKEPGDSNIAKERQKAIDKFQGIPVASRSLPTNNKKKASAAIPGAPTGGGKKTKKTQAVAAANGGVASAGVVCPEFDFSAYSVAMEFLRRMFARKCAYCESLIDDTCTRAEVEHYRPKGAVLIGTQKRGPGYYWLASSWGNLFLSCQLCNSGKKVSVEGKLVRRGKMCAFPLHAGTNRATKPREELLEIPLLIDPCSEVPGAFLCFDEDGVVSARVAEVGALAHAKARETVETYGLDRDDLKAKRAESVMLVRELIEDVRDCLDDLSKDHAENKLLRLRRKVEQLLRRLDEDRPYVSSVRSVVLRDMLAVVDDYWDVFLSLSLK